MTPSLVPFFKIIGVSNIRIIYLNLLLIYLKLELLNPLLLTQMYSLANMNDIKFKKNVNKKSSFKHKLVYMNPFITMLNNVIGKKVLFKINLDITKNLPADLTLTVKLWSARFIRFNTMFGRPLFIKEALYIIAIMLHNKDIEIFIL
jgi:hypothetical protein